jgi:hypothetical protein
MSVNSRIQSPGNLAEISFLQDGVVSRRQLAALGFDSHAVLHRTEAGRWQTLGLAVVVHNGPITERERRWAAVLSARPPAALAGATALALYGLRGFQSTFVHVLVAANARPVTIPQVKWHLSRRFTAADVRDADGLAVVTASRAAVDTASWTSDPRRACAILVAAVQQRVTTTTGLRAELGIAGQIGHGKVLRAVMADIEGGADSLAEIDIGKLAKQAGLPPPIRQSFRLDSDGRRRYLDVDFGTFSVEVDGGFHLRPLNAWDDAHRQNALVLGGDRILRFPSVAIRLYPDMVIAQLRAAYAKFGLPR